MNPSRLQRTLEIVLALVVVVVLGWTTYHAIKGGEAVREVKLWRDSATVVTRANDSLLAGQAAFGESQARLAADNASALASLAKSRSESERLRAAIAAMRSGIPEVRPPVVPGCADWIARAGALEELADSLSVLAAKDSARADSAVAVAGSAESGRVAAVARVDTLVLQLARADSLIRHAPRIPGPARLALLAEARVRTGKTGEAVIGLQSGSFYVAGAIDQDRKRQVEVGGRWTFKVF